MTIAERNNIIEYLTNADEGEYVEYDGRVVEVTNMSGGRYLFFDEEGNVSGQADSELICIKFLKEGGLFVRERYAGDAVVVIDC